MKKNIKLIIALAISTALIVTSLAYLYSFISHRMLDVRLTEAERKAYCGDGIARSNDYIREFLVPLPCSQPLGIAVDDEGNVWFAATWYAKIIKFNPLTDTFIEYDIPVSNKRFMAAMVWSLALDKKGNVWFTDAAYNSIWKLSPSNSVFERYIIPTEKSFPVQLVIDQQGYVWFTEAFGKKLGMLDPSKAKDGTSEGIIEIEPPVKLESLGGLALDGEGNIWLTTLTYPQRGYLLKYMRRINVFKVYEMPPNIRSPVGVAVDKEGNVWISDHGSSLFVKFEQDREEFFVYSTHYPITGHPVSLPYWILVDNKGNIWFNEHQGNAIAMFDPDSLMLIEYHIPSINPFWGNISNPLQIAIGPDGKIWFTEWTENKIAVLDPFKPLSIKTETDRRDIKVNPGDSTNVTLTVTALKQGLVAELTLSGTFSITGKLVNISVTPTNKIIYLKDLSRLRLTITLSFSKMIERGNYTLLIGIRTNVLTVSSVISIYVESR